MPESTIPPKISEPPSQKSQPKVSWRMRNERRTANSGVTYT